jgi:hypothetical protein
MRPNRRHLWTGLYLPGVVREGAGEVAIAVDCSGSVSARQLRLFEAEARSILEGVRSERVYVLYFDAAVHKVDTLLLKLRLAPRRSEPDEQTFTPASSPVVTKLVLLTKARGQARFYLRAAERTRLDTGGGAKIEVTASRRSQVKLKGQLSENVPERLILDERRGTHA